MMEKGPSARVSLPSQQYQNIWDRKHSVKSRAAHQNMLRFSVLWVAREWGMTDGFNNKAHLTEVTRTKHIFRT